MHSTTLVRFAFSHINVKTFRWYFVSYAGRSSKLTPSFISNSVYIFNLHCFLSLSITLRYCMVISLVSPWCYLKPQIMHTSLIQNWGSEYCCSGFRQWWAWFLRIQWWTWLLRSYEWEIFGVAKRWITLRVLGNWISFWYPNILFEVYKC